MSPTKFIVISTSIWMVSMGAISPIIIHQLDKATAKQCLTHDWPKTAHQLHMDWCAGNGYKTNI
jgi:hypothetical protein